MKTPVTPSPKKFWFPAKTYGYGWGLPICREGWAVFISYFILLATSGSLFLRRPTPTLFLIIAGVLTFILILICYWKGEKPSWRWGDKQPPSS